MHVYVKLNIIPSNVTNIQVLLHKQQHNIVIIKIVTVIPAVKHHQLVFLMLHHQIIKCTTIMVVKIIEIQMKTITVTIIMIVKIIQTQIKTIIMVKIVKIHQNCKKCQKKKKYLMYQENLVHLVLKG